MPMAEHKLVVRWGGLVWVDDEYTAAIGSDVWKIGQEIASNEEIVVS
jgi:hypothetical protein